jgi:hypothetical protein
MRPLRIATVGAAAALTLAAVLVPAQAAMAAVTGSFSPSVVAPGDTIEVTGSGCPVAGEVVVSTWITTLGDSTDRSATVTADDAGAFSATVAVHGAPGDLPEVVPPHVQFGVAVDCGGVHTVIGYGVFSVPDARLAAVFTPASIVAPGGEVAISGTGCDAGESVFLETWFPGVDTALVHDLPADADGDFMFFVGTPADGPPGEVISFELTCGPAPVEDPADYLLKTMTFEAAPVDPVDPTDPTDPTVPADPGAGATPPTSDTTPAVVRPKLAATGTEVGAASVALALLLVGATLFGLRRARRYAD